MIKYASLFSGIGGFELGIQAASDKTGIETECVFASEFDPESKAKYINKQPARIIYNKNFGEYPHGDITKIDASNVPDCDLIVGGPPCFVGGTQILTEDGMVSIENVQHGSCVMTHEKRYRKVTKIMSKVYSGKMIKLEFKLGCDGINSTPEHPYYTRKRTRKWNNDKMAYDIILSQPEWTPAEEITTDHYVGTPNAVNKIIPTIEYTHGINGSTSINKKKTLNSEDFWWCVGYYIAEGWYQKRRKRNGIWRVSTNTTACVCKDQIEYVLNKFKKVFKTVTVCEERTVYKLHIAEKCFHSCVSVLGKNSYTKTLPIDFRTFPPNLLEALVGGYVYGDGCKIGNVTAITTTSKKLATDMQCAFSIINKNVSGMYTTQPRDVCMIEGRIVTERECHIVWVRPYNKTRRTCYFEDNILWRRVNNVKTYRADGIQVYNLSVEEDNTYTANGAIVHNCQDFSIAGKRAGLCGTKGSMFNEFIRIVREKQPRYILIENVAGILSANAGWDFARILLALEDAGYWVEWEVRNTKAYIPQNRERVFLVGHLTGSERSGSQIFPIGEGAETVYEEGDGEYICSGTLSTRNQSGQAQWDGSTTLICDSGQGRQAQYRDEIVAPLRANTGAAYNNLVSQNIAKCLTGGGHSGGNHSDMTILNDGGTIRRLTPIEGERLMGFPDNFTVGVADTNRYRCIGNSVTVPVVADIMQKILKTMV